MMRLKKILFPTDYSPCAERALDHAVHMAHAFHAELHILHVKTQARYYPNSYTFSPPIDRTDIEEQLRLPKTDTRAMHSHLPEAEKLPMVDVEMEDEDVPEAIITYAKDASIDLIVMGTHGWRGWDRLILGSVAEKVVQLAPCPVFTIRDQGKKQAADEPRRILVPIDFSDYAELTLVYARELAKAYDAHVDVLHILEEAALPVVYGIEPVSVAVPEIEERAYAALARRAEDIFGDVVPFDVHTGLGYPAHEITAFAEEHQNDLIVMATHGLTGVKHFLLGSVAEKVVRAAPCPVFSVKRMKRSLVETDKEVALETET